MTPNAPETIQLLRYVASISSGEPRRSLDEFHSKIGIVERIVAFAETPTSPCHDVKIPAQSRAFRLRVGDYRVVLRPGAGGRFTVERVADRREVYR